MTKPRSTHAGTRRFVRIVAIVLALTLVTALSACGSAAPTQSLATTLATSAVAASPSPAPATPLSAAAQAQLYATIEREVEGIRELQPKRAVDPTLLDEAGLRAELAAHAAEDATPAEIARQERLLKALGVLAPDADLAALQTSFLAGQVAGFYRPSDGHLYVVSRSGAIGGVERTTFAHEYTHALQDQNFPLLKEIGDSKGPQNGDRDLARLALIEGDATLTMTAWAQQHLSPMDLLGLLRSSLDPTQQAALAAMPPFLRDEALFPYQAGLSFANTLQARGGWGGVNAAFVSPPVSTEQILHPDKYAAHEAPVVVDLPPVARRLGAGWTLDSEDTLGEYELGEWLASSETRAAATAAAAGWGGDRVALYQGPNARWLLVLATKWDTPKDAQEFAAAATVTATSLSQPASVAPVGPSIVVVIASDAETLSAGEAAATL